MPRPGELFRLAAWVYLLLAIAGVAWIGLQRHGVEAALFLPASPWWVDPLAGAGAALALVLGWQAARALPLAHRLEERLRARLGTLSATEAWGLALLSGVAEEVFFRGAVQPAWGYPVATLLFAALHSGRGREMLLWTASALVAGAVLGGLMLWRHTLCAPILCHVLVNGLQLHRLLVEDRPAGRSGTA
ncbi:MAG TPA: CPBP family intramembrane glutamic endopeptidase [Thermoanaerobaculia bacterium]|jgi:membrane protease YdiL (CAAX protease family)|nr:CPBP family intramembrane glutamic endopeptidase [Thermoanaerobaculia bacterium]